MSQIEKESCMIGKENKMMRMKNFLSLAAVCLLALTLLSPAISQAQNIDVDGLIPQLETEIAKMMKDGKVPSASIALVCGDHIIWTGAYGYINLWARTPAKVNCVYLIGSTFKAMSMFALLQQMEEGKFNLDDPVSKYLTDIKIKGEDSSNPVTFRHLLTHTSGLPGDFGAHSVWGETVPSPLKDYLKKSLKLINPPLTKVVYSNMAYTLVAYLLQKFSGVPYKKYIQEHIFNPLEMKDTAFSPRPDMEERLAMPYIVDTKTGKHKPAARLKANVWPAGIVYGTVTNQAHWLIANLNHGVYKSHRLISEETFQGVMKRQHDRFKAPISAGWLNETTGYGLTWWISRRKGDTLFAHSGSVPGYTAFLAGNLDKKTGFAILTNGHRAHKYLFDLAVKALDLMELHRK